MSEFSRETLLNIIETDHVQCGEASALASMALAAMDSESECLPLDYLQGHKDGLEWAAQLAEANHPETGDWLYDDPIELAKAIRKGPDMPPVQPAADSEPVAEITEDLGRLFVKIHHPTALKAGYNLYLHAQPAPVVPDEKDKTVDADDYPLLWSFNEGWNACRASMLHAGNSPAQSDCCPAQNVVAPAQSPIDHGYLPECECAGCKATARICAELSVNSPANPGCWCRTCRPVDLNDMRFVVCPDCGSKRCPRANDHRNACTGSNEPGQEGSAHPDTPQSPGSEPATVPGKWIPVSERMPEVGDIVLTAMGGSVNIGEMECSAANCRFFTSVISGRELPATHWMPLPASPQEVK